MANPTGTAAGTEALPSSPAQLWKRMPVEQRAAVSRVFFDDKDAAPQQAEAMAEIARRLKFRPKSVQALPVERKAKYLASMPISDALASYVLIAYHLEARRPLMGAFLDALGIAHENGVLAGDSISPPGRRETADAIRKLLTEFPPDAVSLYLRTLYVQDTETWAAIAETLEPTLQAAAKAAAGGETAGKTESHQ